MTDVTAGMGVKGKDWNDDPNVLGAMNAFQDYCKEHNVTLYQGGAALIHLIASLIVNGVDADDEKALQALNDDIRAVMKRMRNNPAFFFEPEAVH